MENKTYSSPSQTIVSRAEEMRRHFDACKASGLSVIAYCKVNSLAPSNYYYWQKKLYLTPAKPVFTQVSPVIVHTANVTINYPNGVQVELGNTVNVSFLKELISAKVV